MKKYLLLIIISLCIFSGCNNKEDINKKNDNYDKILLSSKELDLLFKNNNVGLENINNYLLNNSDNLFSKEFINRFNNINYDYMSEFERHLLETYSYFCVISGYSGRSESEIYGYLEDNSFVGNVYAYGYDKDNNALQNERVIVIVAPSYEFSKKVYMYYEVRAIKDENSGIINYEYRDLNWNLDGIDNSLHYLKYSKIFADDFIVKFNYENNNKDFSKLLYYYGFNVLAGGKDGVQGYKLGVQNAIDIMK